MWRAFDGPLYITMDVIVAMQILQTSGGSRGDGTSHLPWQRRTPVLQEKRFQTLRFESKSLFYVSICYQTCQSIQQRSVGHERIHQTQMLPVAGIPHHLHQILMLQTGKDKMSRSSKSMNVTSESKTWFLPLECLDLLMKLIPQVLMRAVIHLNIKLTSQIWLTVCSHE